MHYEDNGTQEQVLCRLYEGGELWDTVEAYLLTCRPDVEQGETQKRTKNVGRFPNLAGLCRYACTGTDDLEALARSFPEAYGRLLAIFEDEALNANPSATLLSYYVKRRIMDGSEAKVEGESEVRYCFEHDVYADGE